jgi:hypothetical protein
MFRLINLNLMGVDFQFLIYQQQNFSYPRHFFNILIYSASHHPTLAVLEYI